MTLQILWPSKGHIGGNGERDVEGKNHKNQQQPVCFTSNSCQEKGLYMTSMYRLQSVE